MSAARALSDLADRLEKMPAFAYVRWAELAEHVRAAAHEEAESDYYDYMGDDL